MPDVERGSEATGSCVFCSIVDRTVASEILFEDDDSLAFLDIAPAVPGHTSSFR